MRGLRRRGGGLGSCWFGVALFGAALACDDKPKPVNAPQAPAQSVGQSAERATADTASSAEVTGPLRLRLATWNIAWLGAEDDAGTIKRSAADFARLAAYARRLDADVIALQEVAGAAAAARVFDPSIYDFHFADERDVQRVGFAFKRVLAVTRHPDLAELDTGDLRRGVDLGVHFGAQQLRLLAVHLKSGCFDGPLDGAQGACAKLARQVPILEGWVDARAREGAAFVVLGDFNRRLFARPDDALWLELDDAEPAGADLDAPTRGQTAACWNARYPHPIDHLVLGERAAPWLEPTSFTQHVYDAGDAPYERVLSDHCALSVNLLLPRDHEASPGSGPDEGEETARGERDPHEPWNEDGANPGVRPVPTESAPTASSGAGSVNPGHGGVVKGNVSGGGARLYHLEGCPNYARVKIDTAKGERLFTSEAEARAAGWSKSPDCP